MILTWAFAITSEEYPGACSRTAICKMAVSIRGPVRSWESRNFGKESVILFQARGKTIHYFLSIKLANWKIRKYILF